MAGTYQFILRRNLIDLGYRAEAAKRETYRIVGGVKGTFNDDWRYEISANYGEFDRIDEEFSATSTFSVRIARTRHRPEQRSGQIVCASQLTGTARADRLDRKCAKWQ